MSDAAVQPRVNHAMAALVLDSNGAREELVLPSCDSEESLAEQHQDDACESDRQWDLARPTETPRIESGNDEHHDADDEADPQKPFVPALALPGLARPLGRDVGPGLRQNVSECGSYQGKRQVEQPCQ